MVQITGRVQKCLGRAQRWMPLAPRVDPLQYTLFTPADPSNFAPLPTPSGAGSAIMKRQPSPRWRTTVMRRRAAPCSTLAVIGLLTDRAGGLSGVNVTHGPGFGFCVPGLGGGLCVNIRNTPRRRHLQLGLQEQVTSRKAPGRYSNGRLVPKQ